MGRVQPRDLKVVHLDEQDIPACVRLAQQSFDEFKGRPQSVEHWFSSRVVNNPWQRSLPGIGVGIRDQGELAAFRAMFAQPWWLRGQSTVAAFAAHTAVDQRYRGQGLGTRMIEASRSFARITGSTSAGDITQKSYDRLGFEAIGGDDNAFFRLRSAFGGSLNGRLGLRLGTPLGRMLDLGLTTRDRRLGSAAGFTLAPVVRCDDEIDRLWESVKLGEASCLKRNSRYLNWRIFDFPTHPLRLSSLRDASGGLRALAIWATTRYSEFVETAVLRDLLYPAHDEVALKRMLLLLIRHWRDMGITWASLEVTSPPLQRVFRAKGYVHVPSRGNRYRIYSEPPLERQVLDNWFRSGLDGDYFDVHA